MSPRDKPLAWLRGEVTTPPFSKQTPATPPTVVAACRKRLEAFQTLRKKKDGNAKRNT